MLPAKYIAFFVWVWLAGATLSAIYEGSYVGIGENTVLNKLAFWQTIAQEQNWGLFEIVGVVSGFAGALFDMLTFKFAFFPDDWVIFEWYIRGPLFCLFVFGFTMTVIGIFSKDL